MIKLTAWVPVRTVLTGEVAFNQEPKTKIIGGCFVNVYTSIAAIRCIEDCIDPQHKDCRSQVVFQDNSAIQVKETADELAGEFQYAQMLRQTRYTPAEVTVKEMRDA